MTLTATTTLATRQETTSDTQRLAPKKWKAEEDETTSVTRKEQSRQKNMEPLPAA